MKATLLFPPQWTAAQPYYGLATLNGQLRAAGHDVVIRDLNLEFVDWVLSPPAVSLAAKRLASDHDFGATELLIEKARDPDSPQAHLLEARLLEIGVYLERHGGSTAALAEAVLAAKDVLRSSASFYDPEALIDAMLTVDAGLRLISLPFYPATVRWNDFHSPLVPLNLEPIVEFCKDPLANPFRRFYEGWLGEILDDGSDVLALSIASFSQVLPGLTLAMMLRERVQAMGDARPTLALGGNFFSRLRDKLRDRPEFFHSFADILIIGEGERAITQLVAAHESSDRRSRLAVVSSALYLDEGTDEVVATDDAPNFSMAEMAFQELAGFELDRYLSPDRVICLRASKGCYYGECSFCDAYHGLERDQTAVDRLVAEMRHLRDAYGVRHFEFVDQCIEPAYLDKMSDAFIAAELGVRWFCNGRTDNGFSSELFEKMRRAGNTMVMWGVESGSPRLLKLMKKGVSPSNRLEILRSSDAADLWNFAYVFFGFPSETEAEAEATIDLIRENIDVIHAYGRSVFTLGRHSPLMADLDRFGILDTIEDDQDLSTNLSFRAREGLQGAAVTEVAARCNEACRAAYGDPLWMALRSRENLHLYLAHHGRDYVRDCDVSSFHRSDPGAEFVF